MRSLADSFCFSSSLALSDLTNRFPVALLSDFVRLVNLRVLILQATYQSIQEELRVELQASTTGCSPHEQASPWPQLERVELENDPSMKRGGADAEKFTTMKTRFMGARTPQAQVMEI